jgi:hypothetical protein
MNSFASLSLIITIALSLATQTSAFIDPEDILGIWTLDEGDGNIAEDSSGNGRDGEIFGTAQWIDEGKFGAAIEFDNGYIRIEHDDDMDLETFSMTAWVKVPQAVATYQYVMGKEAWPLRNYAMWILPDKINVGITSNGGANDRQTQGGIVANDEWHHVASTFDMKLLRTYVDGVKTSEIGLSETPTTNTAPFMIASQPPGGGGPTYGIIDDVGVFKVGLEEEDILDIMNDGLNILVSPVDPESKLYAVWGALKK